MNAYKIAILAAGCFWGVEEHFRTLRGVRATAVGYTGGTKHNADYEDVCRGDTGHAEAVKIEFDPSLISYEDLLKEFWRCHDPTTLNRQGLDVGTQYRSAIFYTDETQRSLAETSKSTQPNAVTEITAASNFYRAEEYHQQYLHKKNFGGQNG